jgi:hypothetical protein
MRVLAQPAPSKVREFADDVRDGKFVLPIGRRMLLRDAAEGHVLARRKAALARYFCWCRIHNAISSRRPQWMHYGPRSSRSVAIGG